MYIRKKRRSKPSLNYSILPNYFKLKYISLTNWTDTGFKPTHPVYNQSFKQPIGITYTPSSSRL